MLTKSELYGWMSYFKYKEPDVQEVQMAILISTVNNALGGKAKTEDYILSHTPKVKSKKVKDNNFAAFAAIATPFGE